MAAGCTGVTWELVKSADSAHLPDVPNPNLSVHKVAEAPSTACKATAHSSCSHKKRGTLKCFPLRKGRGEWRERSTNQVS